MKPRCELNSNWTLSFTHPVTGIKHCFPATVPGNVELDLKREGLVEDIYPADNPVAMYRWGLVNDWKYHTEFESPRLSPGETVELVFEGIDTVAEVFLNGKKIRDCANMFISRAVDVTALLKPTENVLDVHIFSPELQARKFSYDACTFAITRHEGCSYLRKARHMWGWDNAPRLLSAGIWRPVYLQIKKTIRFEDVYLYTRQVKGNSAWLGVDWKFVTPDIDLSGYSVKITFSLNGQLMKEQDYVADQIFGRGRFEIDSPQLWWPRGYGSASLYDVELRLYQNGKAVAEWYTRFGIREVALIRTETTNARGDGEFVFKCNGEKIYCRGTNWKPLDALHSQAKAKLHQALDLCLDCNCNMVRVWGGGVYEDHEFFDYCDEHGLMVWQDFMLACEFPPQDDSYQRLIAEEAEIIIKQLRNHPSLVLWCGDNEIDMLVSGEGAMMSRLRPSDNLITRHVLKYLTLHFDPFRPYLESSPYIADAMVGLRAGSGDDPALEIAPEQHFYTDKVNFHEMYRTSGAHFVSETGPIPYCALSESEDIVAREMPRARRLWNAADNFAVRDWWHQADSYFIQWKNSLAINLKYYYNREFSISHLEELTLATNIMVGDLFKFAIEYFRIHKWRRTGVIWWSLLDMWPMMFNFSVIDSNFRKKRPYYWIKQSQQPFCLIAAKADNGQVDLFAANDTLTEIQGQFRLYRVDNEGKEEVYYPGVFQSGKNTSSIVAEKMDFGKNHGLYVIEWSVNGKKCYNHFIYGEPPFSFDEYRLWCAYLDRLYDIEHTVSFTFKA